MKVLKKKHIKYINLQVINKIEYFEAIIHNFKICKKFENLWLKIKDRMSSVILTDLKSGKSLIWFLRDTYILTTFCQSKVSVQKNMINYILSKERKKKIVNSKNKVGNHVTVKCSTYFVIQNLFNLNNEYHIFTLICNFCWFPRGFTDLNPIAYDTNKLKNNKFTPVIAALIGLFFVTYIGLEIKHK